MVMEQRRMSLSTLGDPKPAAAARTLLQFRTSNEEKRLPARDAVAPVSLSSPAKSTSSPGRERSASLTLAGPFGGSPQRLRRITWGGTSPSGDEEDPGSPVSRLVRHSLAERPGFATVRRVSLREVALPLPGAVGEEKGTPPSRAQAAPFPEAVRSNCTSSLRPLTSANLFEKGSKASQIFHEAHDVNRRARSKEAVGEILADARRHREFAKHPELTPQDMQEIRTWASLSQQERVEAFDSAVATPPRRMSLLEQFGYGVRPMEVAKLTTAPPPETSPPSRKTNFLALKHGKNDLKERLASRRRHTVE